MIRLGYIVLILLFVAAIVGWFVLISSAKNHADASLEHQDLLRRASALERSAPEEAEALRQKAAQAEIRLTSIERTRKAALRGMWLVTIPMVLLGALLAATSVLSTHRAATQAAPVPAQVLAVRKTGRIRNGCPVVIVQLEIESPGSDSTVEGSTKVMLCDELPEIQGSMTAVRADQVQPGMRILARYSPAVGGVVRLLQEDLE